MVTAAKFCVVHSPILTGKSKFTFARSPITHPCQDCFLQVITENDRWSSPTADHTSFGTGLSPYRRTLVLEMAFLERDALVFVRSVFLVPTRGKMYFEKFGFLQSTTKAKAVAKYRMCQDERTPGSPTATIDERKNNSGNSGEQRAKD